MYLWERSLSKSCPPLVYCFFEDSILKLPRSMNKWRWFLLLLKNDLSTVRRPGLFSVTSSYGKEAFLRWGGHTSWHLSLRQFKAQEQHLLFPLKYSAEKFPAAKCCSSSPRPDRTGKISVSFVRNKYSLCFVGQRDTSVRTTWQFVGSSTGVLLQRLSTAVSSNMRLAPWQIMDPKSRLCPMF